MPPKAPSVKCQFSRKRIDRFWLHFNHLQRHECKYNFAGQNIFRDLALHSCMIPNFCQLFPSWRMCQYLDLCSHFRAGSYSDICKLKSQVQQEVWHPVLTGSVLTKLRYFCQRCHICYLFNTLDCFTSLGPLFHLPLPEIRAILNYTYFKVWPSSSLLNYYLFTMQIYYITFVFLVHIWNCMVFEYDGHCIFLQPIFFKV
jgi:hypothetical protein